MENWHQIIDINAILKTVFWDVTNPRTNRPVHELTASQIDSQIVRLPSIS